MRRLVGTIVTIIVLLTITGCSMVEKGELFDLKGTSIKDIEVIDSIIEQLPYNNNLFGFELEMGETSGIILKYKNIEQEDKVKILISSVSYLQFLVEDLEQVTLYFDDIKYVVTKDDVEKWYVNKDLENIKNEEELKNIIQDYMKTAPYEVK